MGIVPTGGWGGWASGPCWDSVLIYLPYFSYILRGDLRGAKEISGSMLRYFHFITSKLNEKGLIEMGLGDWCAPGKTSTLEFAASVTAYDLAKKAAVLYNAMDMDAEAAYVNVFADKMKKNIRKHLCDLDTMTFDNNCQTSQAMAIYYGICDTKEEEQKALSVLLDRIREKDDHMDMGVLGGRVIFRVLADHGYMDLALNMMCRPDGPSYGYMVEAGYNTLLETNFRDTDSCNHHFWGDISAFMIEYIAGIRPNPELKIGTMNIAPMFPTKLDHAEGYYNVAEGKVESKWVRNGDEIILTVTAPDGLKGDILTPCGYQFENGNTSTKLASGEYKIVKI
jgi:alpha-L-rhamnosidase